MRLRTGRMPAAGALALGLAGARAAGAATLGGTATAYALGNDGTTLVTVASASGATAAVDLSFEGGARVSLDAID